MGKLTSTKCLNKNVGEVYRNACNAMHVMKSKLTKITVFQLNEFLPDENYRLYGSVRSTGQIVLIWLIRK